MDKPSKTLKQPKNPVIAYGDNLTQSQYFLASYADEIYLHNLGNILLTGFGLYRNYVKDAADSLAIKFHLFKAGDYKDAAENFTRNNMSDESFEHNSYWITQLWERYTSRISHSRQLGDNNLDLYIANLASELNKNSKSHAQHAKEYGLVDNIVSRNEFRKLLVGKFGESKKNENTFKHVSYARYLSEVKNDFPIPSENNIGLIAATGTIVDGYNVEGAIGSEDLVDLLRLTADDDTIKAVVIRIDSGGGSAFASEIIRDEIVALQSSGKPVYISMGSVAASGGYWLATAANEIWATPATITGSIGVWTLIPNISDTLANVGIYSDGIGTSPIADAFQLDREMAEPVKQLIQASVDGIYAKFLDIVAEARNSTPEQVNQIAQGRVWTGVTAKDIGLVDHIGTLQDVIDAAANQQNLDNYKVKYIERPLSIQEQIIRALSESSSVLGDKIVTEFENKFPILTAVSLSSDTLFEVIPYVEHNEATVKCFVCLEL